MTNWCRVPSLESCRCSGTDAKVRSIGVSYPLKEGVAQFVTALQEYPEANVSAVKHLCVDVLEGGKLCEHLPREREVLLLVCGI